MLRLLAEKATPLLRWMEKYTKTDMLYLAKGGFWLMLGQGILVVSGLVLSVAFANLLPKDVYGTYQFVMSGSVIISALTLIGLSSAVMRATARGDQGALRAGVRTMLRWSGGIVFSGAALALYYYINGNSTLALSFLIVGCFSPLLGAYGLTKPFLIGAQRFRESALMGFWRRFMPVAALLATVYVSDDPVTIVFVYFASNALSAWLQYRLIVSRFDLPLSEDENIARYGKHLSFLSIVSTLAGQLDKVLIWTTLGAAPLAAYTLAQLPIGQIQNAFKLLLSLSFPKLSKSDLATLQETLPHKVRLFLLGTVLIAGAYAFAAPHLFGVLFPLYPESVLLSQVLALTLLSKPRSLYGQALTAHQKKKEQYIISLGSSAVKVIALLTLIPLYGLWGAVYALLIENVFSNILIRYLFSVAK